ncbi:hypothetical protein Tco_1115088 [Tanacetum coccineum]
MFSRETIEGAQGYKVKNANESILEDILKKHGGLEATCLFSDVALRTREHHTHAYLSSVEDSRARNFSRETIEGAQGYKVKNANEAILKAILKKHGGLEATCVFSDAALRTREHHTRAYISSVEDSRARNFSQETIKGAQGYKVKKTNEAILEAILKKHGGLEASCVFLDAALRTSLLYVVYEHLY